jgi:hypothetical protein
MRIAGWILGVALAGSSLPAAAQAPANPTRIYFLDEIGASGLPDAAAQRRRAALQANGLCPEDGLEASPAVAAVAMGVFAILRGIVERAAESRAARRLAALVSTQAATLSAASHPLAGKSARCLVFDRAGEATDDAVYAVRLERLGANAMVARVVHAEVNATPIWGERGLPRLANVTIALGIQTLAPGKAPPELDAPLAWQGMLGPLAPGQPRQSGLPASGVIPLRDGGPTTLSLAITEAHPEIDRLRERQLVAAQTRKLLLDTLSGALDAAVAPAKD